jgi:hypothetical protein
MTIVALYMACLLISIVKIEKENVLFERLASNRKALFCAYEPA